MEKIAADNKLDGIFCVAGGWAGGNAAHDDFVRNTDLMMKQSIWTSVISSNIAAHFLKDGGLLTLTGAAPCINVCKTRYGLLLTYVVRHVTVYC